MGLIARGTDTATAVIDPPARTAQPVKRIREGSPQQQAFWAELLAPGGSQHLLLEARAGTGKSSSCREGMHRILDSGRRLSLAYCCYNKKIADEFRTGCPPGVEVGTMHSMGLTALRRALTCIVDQQKTYQLLDGQHGGADLPRWLRKAIATIISHAKNHALRPDQPDLENRLWELVEHFDIECWRRTAEAVQWAKQTLALAASHLNTIDFDDMLWLPVLMGLEFPSCDYLFIDECQDLNAVQHELVHLMNPHGRTVIVGDPFQSIYAWRGADANSIPKLREQLDAKTMPLTITWRCPRSHVELARRLVPDFEARPDAPEGELIEADERAIGGAQPGDLVLCRTNAPIIAACLEYIRHRKRAIVRGRALGDQLKTILRPMTHANTRAQLVREIMVWEAKEVERLSVRDGTDHLVDEVQDKAAALMAIAETCDSPAAVPKVIDELFADDDAAGRVTFSTVHRAKGSEAHRVSYIQVPYKTEAEIKKPPPAWQLDQRRNLRYVALTRAMDHLTLITPRREEKR